MRHVPCKSCRRPMLFALTERGRRIPLDVDPYQGEDPGHLYVLRDREKPVPTAVAVTPDAFPDEPVYRSHFRSCSDPGRHSRRRR